MTRIMMDFGQIDFVMIYKNEESEAGFEAALNNLLEDAYNAGHNEGFDEGHADAIEAAEAALQGLR